MAVGCGGDRSRCRCRSERVEHTINVVAQVLSPWVPHPPTFPDGIHQELSDFTPAVASEVVGERRDDVNTRNAKVPGRARSVHFTQVVQRSCTLSWHSESNLGRWDQGFVLRAGCAERALYSFSPSALSLHFRWPPSSPTTTRAIGARNFRSGQAFGSWAHLVQTR